MKAIIPVIFLLCLVLFTTCDEKETEVPALTCLVNGEKWESISTKCDLYTEQTCKQRYMKLIATTLGGNQLVLTIYNYQDTVCDEMIGPYDYFIENTNNFCEVSDSTILCREVLSYYKLSSGAEYFAGDDLEDRITITSCDAKNKLVSGNFNIHFYDTKNGVLVYEAVSGKFEDVNYYIHTFY